MKQRIEEILAKVGLTAQESRTYLGLLRLKEAQTGKLCKETGIASSNIYKILNSLTKKGLVSYRLRNNIKIFMPSSPDTLNELFLEREKNLSEERKEIAEVIQNLKAPSPDSEIPSNYKYFEGISGAKAMWYEITDYIITIGKNKITKVYTQKKEAYEHMVGFYDEFHKARARVKAKYQMILPLDDRKLGEKRKKGNKEVETKYMDLKNEAGWGVIGGKFYIQTLIGKLPVGFLINDEKIAKTFEQVFNQLWKQAKN